VAIDLLKHLFWL